ncbi:response regulator [Paenibacillus sp. PAMC21692]|uniref:response regulator n=1 Tax=Paenibacillus sp. PAMC21692 TaxID=2762320 RepID=UPI00164EC278|nr:response regulator [Paenibacillus sp. PAMC21692]QNK59568.1 response regulator [Paenibacillus sp. PAMC21692]
MYKLFIVDDESSVRSGLRECVDWSAFGLEVAGEAEDGEMALRAIRETKGVRIVLTDVRMPHLDGIGLAERLTEEGHPAKFVFISGYGDLDYLKKAIRLEAVDYLLKPVRLGELTELLRRLVDKLDAEEEEIRTLNGLHMKLNQSIPLLRERHLAALVLDGAKDLEALRNKFEFLGIRLPVSPFRLGVFAIRIDDYGKVIGALPEKERQLQAFALLNIIEDVLNERYPGHAFEVRTGEYAGIVHFASDDEEDGFFALIQRVKEQINRLLKLEVTIGVGPAAERWEELPNAYGQAARASEHKWYVGKNQIISMDGLIYNPSTRTNGGGEELEPKEIAALLKGSDRDALRLAAEKAFEGGEETNAIFRTRIAGAQLLAVCAELRREMNLPAESLEDGELRLWQAIVSAETVAELRDEAVRHLNLTYAEISDKRKNKTHNVVAQICRYIEEHYAEDLTNAQIAASVYLTTTYVCLLFKQETGRTLNEYIIETRIAAAKALLADPANKLYDVCYAVGYKDPGYFGKLFKKQTGYTPGEFRERGL